MFGSFANIATCPNCHGQGKIIEEPCESCRGTGRAQHSRKINVNIPAGIDNGQIITLSGQGEAGNGAVLRGDLLVYIQVKPHKTFCAGRRKSLHGYACELWPGGAGL